MNFGRGGVVDEDHFDGGVGGNVFGVGDVGVVVGTRGIPDVDVVVGESVSESFEVEEVAAEGVGV